VRKGVALLGPEFVARTVDAQTYWLPGALAEAGTVRETVFLLPAFDEFLISYKDRSASLTPQSRAEVITINGIFRPVVLVNGQVAGTWKRTVKNGAIRVQTELFGPDGSPTGEQIENAAAGLGQFLDAPVGVTQTIL
ncbi:MAG: winged helix DNA-binding domain-containing protein, partial [Cytophagales bacterium]|nr:winged helix DNA-binding domain-containing protein [Cytophagales bacterium]